MMGGKKKKKKKAEPGKYMSQSSAGLTLRSIHTNHKPAAMKTSIHPSMGVSSLCASEWQKSRHARAAFVMWMWVWLQVSESIDTGGYKASEVRYILLTWPYHLTTALIYLSDPFCVEETNVLSCSVLVTGPLCIIHLLMLIQPCFFFSYPPFPYFSF